MHLLAHRHEVLFEILPDILISRQWLSILKYISLENS